MSGFSQLGQNLERGYLMGRQTGGRVSNLGSIIGEVADRLRQEREGKQALTEKQNLLGYEGLLKGVIEPTQEGGFDVPGLTGKYRSKKFDAQNIPEGFEIAGYNAEGSPYLKKIKAEEAVATPLKDVNKAKAKSSLLQSLFGKKSLPAGVGKAESNAGQIKKEYPNAFQENGVWKVMQNGKKYRIE